MKKPSPQLVAEAFIRTISDGSWGCTTTLPALEVADQKGLPKDNWSGKELWVTPKGYGTGSFIGPVKKPLLVVQIWGKPKDRRRIWGSAEALGEDLIDLGVDWTTNLLLAMPYPGYCEVELSSFTPRSDIRRIEGDPQGLARVEFDVELTYSFKL